MSSMSVAGSMTSYFKDINIIKQSVSIQMILQSLLFHSFDNFLNNSACSSIRTFRDVFL